ncbi:dihydroorotase [Acidocella sp.]|uniref:dihydroorotase n=1 Tax=Acidocella sp. TaxID=50710 RepID=UPI002622C83D|nr:dihydroorotase [Acidocella sp.]
MSFDLIIENGTVVLPWGEVSADVGVTAGHITAIGKNLGDAPERFNAANLHVLPGIIDPHVHFRDGGYGGIPGVEDMRSGSLAAVLGGVTTVFDMPNTKPPTTDPTTVQAKYEYIPGHTYCDLGFYVGATKENADHVGEMEDMPGVCAVKVFAGSSTGDLLVEDDENIERVLRGSRHLVAFHAEDEYRLRERKSRFSVGDPYAAHGEWRDPECARLGTARVTALAEKTGKRAHILHVSTAEEFAFIRDHKRLLSAEVLVNHLLQAGPEAYERLGGYAVMNPPIRDKHHQDAAWAALLDGTADTIASDHAPHTAEAKERPWPTCHSGLTGVQTLLPLMLSQVNAGRLPLMRLVDLMSAGPARIYGAMGKGRIAVGYDADFSIVDMKARRKIENSWIASQCGWTPFAGTEVTAWPVATIVRGHVVMFEGVVTGEPIGQPVLFRH